MKIAVLNLPFDNNYGGNLQRYALITILQRMGHQVEHINLQPRYSLPWFKKPFSYAKRIAKKLFLNKNTFIFLEKQQIRQAKERNVLAMEFYEKYIPHTQVAYSITDIKTICTKQQFDAYVVGSDQVWRTGMTGSIGLENYFLKFTSKEYVKRIAYAVSMGTDEGYSQKQVKSLASLYRNFDAVSVRECVALDIFKSYGWDTPKPTWVLDPTLLLDVQDYLSLIEASNVISNLTVNKIFCYILDLNEEALKVIAEKETELHLESIRVGLADTARVSIEQWLCNIKNCELVITDSFHGVVFSILFNRSFLFLGNSRRGNMRIDSLFKMLDISSAHTLNANWGRINELMQYWRTLSKAFLEDIL